MSIAEKKEILEFFTLTMRGENIDTITGNMFKAAENLGKYYGLFKGEGSGEGGDVIIVDDIGRNTKNTSQ